MREILISGGIFLLYLVGYLVFQNGLRLWGRELRRQEDWEHAPIQSGQAVLLKKKSEQVDLAHPSQSKTIYQGVFRLGSGKKITLTMEAAQFYALSEQMPGEISYRGFRLISFEPFRNILSIQET